MAAAQGPDAQGVQDARTAGLRYVAPSLPGIVRLRAGKGFRYRHPDGSRVADAATLERIRALAIPPAWQRVWICPLPNGHLQATGCDQRGRKQYRYHARWRRVRDADKFDRMLEFGQSLPALRRRMARDLALPGLPREKVLALVVALLDATLARIGNDRYARDNRSYGLSTLRSRHARFVRDGRLRLSFRGKGGAEHDLAVDNRRLVGIVRRCQQLPGQALFQYLDDDGARHPVESAQVNAYLAGATGAEFTAKDFRTWAATVRALALLTGTPQPVPPSERALASAIAAMVREVASDLGNTPAVCRSSYIHPAVIATWRAGTLPAGPLLDVGRAPRKAEQQALRFLRRFRRDARKR